MTQRCSSHWWRNCSLSCGAATAASAILEHRMSLLLRKLYGSKSEKLDPRQTSLFDLLTAAPEGQTAVVDEAPLVAAGDASTDETPAATSLAKHRRGHG